jgi:CRP-like cAMP-binding protein
MARPQTSNAAVSRSYSPNNSSQSPPRPSTSPTKTRNIIPVLKNISTLNNGVVESGLTMATAVRSRSNLSSLPTPHEIDFVGQLSAERHGGNNLLCSRALEMQPTTDGVLSSRGVNHRSTESYINNVVLLTNQLDHGSRYEKRTLQMGQIYFQRAMSYASLGSYSKAMYDYGIAIEIFNAHKHPCGVCYFNRALLHYSQQDIKAALADIDTAIDVSPGNSTYFNTRALLLRKSGDFIRSISDVELVKRLKKKKDESDEKKHIRRVSVKPLTASKALVNGGKDEAKRELVTQPRKSLLLTSGGAPDKAHTPSSHHSDSIISYLTKPGKQRSKLERHKIANVLKHFEFFALMKDDEKALSDISGKITIKKFAINEYIFHQGDTGDVFYILLQGAVSITSFVPSARGGESIERVWKMLHKGDHFGETALKSVNGKRSANAKCTQESILIVITCDDYHLIQSEHEVFLREMKLNMVARCPAFCSIDSDTLNKVVDKMHIKRYDAQTVITNRGDKASELSLIRKGMVKVLKSTPLELCESNGGENDAVTTGGGSDESPGIWVIQRNWREIMEPMSKNMTMQETLDSEHSNNHDFTVGVLGSGEFFGELAVLDETEYSPVTVIACTNVELYVLDVADIKECGLHIDHNLKKFLVESMVLHNPPAKKVAHYFRSKVNWEGKKEKILESCMSGKWIEGKRRSSMLKRLENMDTNDKGNDTNSGRRRRESQKLVPVVDSDEKTTKPKKYNSKLLKQQFSLRSITGKKKFQF